MKSLVKNGYQFGELLGEGAYSKVYKGLKLDTQQTVAIKVFKEISKNSLENIQNEVKILRSFNHPNIIQCFDYFKNGKSWYAVFQYCGKGDLQKYMNQQLEQKDNIPEQIAKNLIYKILSALNYIHQNKIAHRDLKLPNILISDDYDVKLADFGLSKDYDQKMLMSFCGTPLTMAPQVLMRSSYTEKCDTWSLGVIGYYLLCGDYPFKGSNEENLKNTIFRQKHPKFPAKFSISPQAKDFISKCLTIEVAKRPSINEDLLNDPWFVNAVNQSSIRKQYMKISMGEQSQMIKKTNLAISVAINNEISNLIKLIHLTETQINRIVKYLDYFYPQRKFEKFLLILLAAQKNKQLLSRNIKFIIDEVDFQIKCQKLKIIKTHVNHITELLQAKAMSMKESVKQFKEQQCSNQKKKLIRFITKEGQLLLNEPQSTQNLKKVKFFKNLVKFINSQIDLCQVVIEFKENTDSHNSKDFVTYVHNAIQTQKIVDIVNKTDSNDSKNYSLLRQFQDSWLIKYQNQLKRASDHQILDRVCQAVQLALNLRQEIYNNTKMDQTC